MRSRSTPAQPMAPAMAGMCGSRCVAGVVAGRATRKPPASTACSGGVFHVAEGIGEAPISATKLHGHRRQGNDSLCALPLAASLTSWQWRHQGRAD